MLFAYVLLLALVAVLVILLIRFWNRETNYRNQLQRYSGIADLDAAIETAKSQLEEAKQGVRATAEEDKRRREQLETQYKQALTKFEELKHEVSLLEENLDVMSFGLYKPHFTFQTSEEHKDALIALRNKMKDVTTSGGAATCPVGWTVNDSKQEGAKMIRQTTKVMLRAFNGECDAAGAHVSYNNIHKMEERVTKAFEAINKLGETMHLSITNVYFRLRLDELRLINEYETKKYQEKEEERDRREKMRDAEKAQREIEQAQEEAEAQEAAYQKLLEKARQEAAAATGSKLEELTKKVSEFSAKLDEARQKKEKAIARAQLTKSGFVYVISNVGAFGDGVFKVGMTRRLEPMDRIMELSGAAVPFPFDLHAMMFSDDAPSLECALHNFLEDRRLNLVNTRKEFFHSVKLPEIRGFVEARGLSAQFIQQPEAREYRETLAKRQAQRSEESEGVTQPPRFAESPFAVPVAAETA
jgi:Domain of unknown function (DUF4041)/Meiotically up-regulated gene 113